MSTMSSARHPTLLVRADASPEIGTGHVMRCLALAQAWQDEGGRVSLVGDVPTALRGRLEEEQVGVNALNTNEAGGPSDASETARYAGQVRATWIVVDGYHFGSEYQRQLLAEGFRVLFIDDYGHADCYEADLVLNQNIDAEPSLYAARADHTNLLLGPRFALLRKEFWPWRESRCEIRSEAEHILVTLGGADPDNRTTEVIGALDQLDRSGLRATVVVGGSNPHEKEIRERAGSVRIPTAVRQNVDNMAELMAESDLAVSAGGSTCWELSFMGIPTVTLVLADNQSGIANGLDEAGTAINLGWHETAKGSEIEAAVESLLQDDWKRRRMARKAQALVDGRGGERVLAQMESTVRAADSYQRNPTS